MDHLFRVILVDDHVIVRREIASMLERVKTIRVVGEAGDGQEALDKIKLLDPDMVILDIEMPIMDGLEVARRLRADQHFDHNCILILSGYNDRVLVEEALRIGVEGYLLKDDVPDFLFEVLEKIASGERGFFSRQVLAQTRFKP